MENIMERLKKLKVKLSYDCTIPFLRIYPQEKKYLKGHLHPYVHCSISRSSQDWKQPKCLPMEVWIMKLWYIFAYNGIFFSI